MRAAVMPLVLAAACRAPGPPHGPEHQPVNSPEPASRCPAEAAAAKSAREDLISATGEARQKPSEAAARAVLAQAACEHSFFDRWRIEAGSQAIMAAELRAARGQYLSTRTLYLEAAGYGDGRLRVGAQARLADLDLAFARKLDELPAPVDLHDPAGRTDHRRQMRELMQTFEIEAALSASRALDAASSEVPADDDELRGWVRASCEKLAVLDPEGHASYPACRGGEETR